MPVLPLKQGILLPGAVVPFTIGRARSLAAVEAAAQGPGHVLVALQREPVEEPGFDGLLETATLGRIVRVLGERGSLKAVLVEGLSRATLLRQARTGDSWLQAEFAVDETPWPKDDEAEGMWRAFLAAFEANAALGQVEVPVEAIRARPPAMAVDSVAALLDEPFEWKRQILQTFDPVRRAELVIAAMAKAKGAIEAQKAIEDRVRSELGDAQREALLRQQLKAIQAELGEGEGDDELGRLKAKLAAKALPPEAREAVDRELRRLERIQSQSPERSVALDWLQWISELPFGVSTATGLELDEVEEELNRTHHGLSDVKRQVIEHLAVRKLEGKGRADVLLLVGPPGVGKTSIGQAIADATGRKLVRVALGGVRDEAELRGHRRTYIGSRPGRLIEGLRRAQAADPVVLLDEVDKLAVGGWQGDPRGALLEILDPEQNHSFVDHYLEVPFDLSRILFVATANDLHSIPEPLLDRMEVIQIEGYARHEKRAIAKEHIIEKLAKNAGVSVDDVLLDPEIFEDLIEGWTLEAGVRQLQRILGKIFRAAAVKKARGELAEPLMITRENLVEYVGRRRFPHRVHEVLDRPGIAMGLAWTPLGGDVLFVEAALVPGSGKLVLTGQLGDVMKESAQAALTYVLSRALELGIDPEVIKSKDLHVHVPSGGTPKDGPSAGVTMFTALASLLSGRPVGADVAMTGEATLRGRVLAVGGIKAKLLAAHAHGVRRVLIPRQNLTDADELPAEVREALEIVVVDHMEDVLAEALLRPGPAPEPPMPKAREAARSSA